MKSDLDCYGAVPIASRDFLNGQVADMNLFKTSMTAMVHRVHGASFSSPRLVVVHHFSSSLVHPLSCSIQ